jgi:hypothetical protein
MSITADLEERTSFQLAQAEHTVTIQPGYGSIVTNAAGSMNRAAGIPRRVCLAPLSRPGIDQNTVDHDEIVRRRRLGGDVVNAQRCPYEGIHTKLAL